MAVLFSTLNIKIVNFYTRLSANEIVILKAFGPSVGQQFACIFNGFGRYRLQPIVQFLIAGPKGAFQKFCKGNKINIYFGN